MAFPAQPSAGDRIVLLDIARAAALMAMVVYHFTWDLEFFEYLQRGFTAEGGWRLFARLIASSFLFLSGVSLYLAHGSFIRWRPFWTRLTQVAGAALLISIATYFFTPEGFVFFGILHQIALASLLALPFLRAPSIITIAAALVIIILPSFVETSLTNPRYLAWIGLSENPPTSNDFVPIFPWFGAVLLGIAAARLAATRGIMHRLSSLARRGGVNGALGWLGRHSLPVYLIHQPILLALVWSFAQFSPPDPARVVRSDCQRSCTATHDAAFCSGYCTCVVDRLQSDDLLASLREGLPREEDQERLQTIVAQCSFSPGG